MTIFTAGKIFRKRHVILGGAFLALLIAGALVYGRFQSTPQPDYRSVDGNYPIERDFKYSMTVRNATRRPVDRGRLWLHLPVAFGAAQKFENIETSQSHRLFRDDLGNQVAYVEFDDLSADAVLQLTFEFRMRHSDTSHPMPEHDITRYLETNGVYEMDSEPDPVSALRGDDAGQTVGNILAHLKGEEGGADPSMNQDSVARDDGRSDGPENLDGEIPSSDSDSDQLVMPEQTNLAANGNLYRFIALCRTLDVPARVVIGARISGDETIVSDDFIYWAEFHDGETWHIADLQETKVVTEESGYLAFRVLDSLPESRDWEPYDLTQDASLIEPVRGSLKLRTLQ